MGKALDILRHIEELYVAEPDFDKLDRMVENNPERLDAWEKAFADYDLIDVLNAIDAFWEFKSSKSRPSVVQIKAKLNAREVEKVVTDKVQDKALAPAEQLMNRDIELKRCRHNLYIYKQAVDYVLSELLLQEIPAGIWRKMRFEGKYAAAKNKGLFDDFDDILVGICRRDLGKDYEFDSEAMIEAQKANRNFDVNRAASKLGETWVNGWWHN